MRHRCMGSCLVFFRTADKVATVVSAAPKARPCTGFCDDICLGVVHPGHRLTVHGVGVAMPHSSAVPVNPPNP